MESCIWGIVSKVAQQARLFVSRRGTSQPSVLGQMQSVVERERLINARWKSAVASVRPSVRDVAWKPFSIVQPLRLVCAAKCDEM